MNKKGFTLIEMLIVIAVIGVLAIAVLSAINPETIENVTPDELGGPGGEREADDVGIPSTGGEPT